MRKIAYIPLVALSFALFSCTDTLDLQPKSDLTEKNFFKKTSDVELALVGCYDGLQTMSLSRDFVLMDMRSDLSTSILAEGEYGYIDTFVKDIVESGDMYTYWKSCFNALSRANLVLQYLDVVTDDEIRDRIEAEARFIRAYIYFNMVRLWGDLPLLDRPISAGEKEMFKRQPATDIYQKIIIPDLQFGISSASFPDMTKGKANKTAAKALLAKVYLTLNRHDEAKSLLAGMINFGNPANSSIAGVGLTEEYATIFSASTKWTSEILFAIQFNSSSGEGQTFSYEFSSFGAFRGLNTPTAPFLAECEADPVRYQTNITIEDNGSLYTVCGKFIEEGTKPSQKDNAADMPILRFADVLLMYTEAVLGAPSESYVNTSTSDANAVAAYNAVRARAGYEPVGSVTRNELLLERKLEFAFENHRWFDLQRIAGKKETIRIMEEHGVDPTLESKQYFSKVEEFQLIYPIPGREIRVIGKDILTQNPGY